MPRCYPKYLLLAYRARIFGDNPLHKIFNEHWQDFVGAYEERFQQTCGALRGTAKHVVKRFLDCGSPMNGFARIKCSTCGAERLLHFSCRTRGFCPRCQARQSEEWAGWSADEFSESVFHRQMIITIPKILRAYFHYDRKLLTDLSMAAHRAVSRFVETTAGAGVRPAMAVVKHAFGEGVRFHPHLHALVASAGWTRNRVWHPMETWKQNVLSEFFEREVSISRIRHDRDQAKAQIDPHGAHNEECLDFDILDLIARLTVQIPESHERLVHYYGLYSNASGQRRVSNGRLEASACPADHSAATLYPLESVLFQLSM